MQKARAGFERNPKAASTESMCVQGKYQHIAVLRWYLCLVVVSPACICIRMLPCCWNAAAAIQPCCLLRLLHENPSALHMVAGQVVYLQCCMEAEAAVANR
mgnify:CR=1 FL=1